MHQTRSPASHDRNQRWWRRPWIWVLLVSLVFAVVPPWIDPGNITLQLGLVFSLVGVVLSFVVEQHQRSEAVRTEFQESLQKIETEQRERLSWVEPFAGSSQEFRRYVQDIAPDWARSEEWPLLFVKRIFHNFREEFKARLHALAEGEVEIPADRSYSFRATDPRDFKEFHMVHATPIEFWTTQDGKGYLDRQAKAIATNQLEVKRIIVVGEDEIVSKRDLVRRVVQAQVAAGVTLKVLVRESVAEHIEDFGIVKADDGNPMLIKPKVSARDHEIDSELFLFGQAKAWKVDAAWEILRRLNGYAVEPEEIFPELVGQPPRSARNVARRSHLHPVSEPDERLG